MEMGCGDEEEHAVILRNYLQHIAMTDGGSSQDVYIVLGSAIPEGSNTVYVLQRYAQYQYLIDELVGTHIVIQLARLCISHQKLTC